jgi:hypothetical protein
MIPYYLYKALKARNLIFYLATNPAIKYSGNGTESKYKTIELIPEKYRPKTVFVKEGTDFELIKKKIEQAAIHFPLIAKPDVGFRGFLVQKINDLESLNKYLQRIDVDIMIQEFVDLKNECGILYARVPGSASGRITSITLKKFLSIVGDGKSSLSELILQDQRASVYYAYLKKIHEEHMDAIPEKGLEKIISVIGNHARGTQFLNGNHLIDDELVAMLDRFNKQIDGWYYGRLDIKYDSFEQVKNGEGFKVLEINGIIAEPTHIYDPTTGATYFDALKELKRHWSIMNDIAIANHKHNKIPYPKLIPYLKDIAWLRTYSKKLKRLNK